ncbi:MscL family protein [Tessaracoccus sp. HDW20]|uniref:MscL family protein n=1 Tax=Tessaracoccus coleopterorum TaxID=2714950 RepID=UPI0018D4AC35|nr:MscL family protein [Tessaracoccus coleopterorum]NHB84451.1 MscL family protein [Tessaracoccus coleopterorum]
MKGFKEFLLRGNLVELAVAFVIGGAFATVVTAFTTMFMDILGKLGGTPDFSGWNPGGISVGAFLTALVAFVIMAGIVYFGVVLPYNKAKALFEKKPAEEEATAPTAEELLTDIRDALVARNN